MGENIISGIITAAMAIAWAAISVSIALMVWDDYKEKRK
jgi:hypothetical protein